MNEIARLPTAVNPAQWAADELKRTRWPNEALMREAGQKRQVLLQFAPRITFGSDEPQLLYTMAKMILDRGQRAAFRAFLDQVDQIEGIAPQAGPVATSAALSGFQIPD